ncbi:MAG: hypothetical protein NXI16_01240 [Alphaproteobacteria bacterium]|nr:hypothetical protein [Alphaproteobacteria bacterium]
MAAGNFVVYGLAKQALLTGDIDINSGTFVGVLLTSSYTPDAVAHSLWSDVSANEVSGTGYTAGGAALTMAISHASGTVTVDETTNPSWPASTLTAKYFVIVQRAGGSLVAGDRLLAFVDLDTGGGSITTTSQTLQVTMNASGVFTLA